MTAKTGTSSSAERPPFSLLLELSAELERERHPLWASLASPLREENRRPFAHFRHIHLSSWLRIEDA
ncbi:hypothetical protein BSNK01_13990 [Bacillaceae bacterium]